MTDLEIIQEYKNMKKVSDFTEITGVNYSNLIQGKSTRANEFIIATLCKVEITRLYKEIIKDEVVIKNEKTNTL